MPLVVKVDKVQTDNRRLAAQAAEQQQRAIEARNEATALRKQLEELKRGRRSSHGLLSDLLAEASVGAIAAPAERQLAEGGDVAALRLKAEAAEKANRHLRAKMAELKEENEMLLEEAVRYGSVHRLKRAALPVLLG